MELLYGFLLGCLGFAGLALLLLGGNYIFKECCRSRKKPSLPHPQPDPEPTPLLYPRLPSRASAPILTELHEMTVNPPFNGGIRRKSSVVSLDVQISQEEIRAIQTSVLRSGELASADDSTNCNLLIGVFANAQVFCGYCVNLVDKWVEFYKIGTEHLPWRVIEHPDSSDFEMRNFFFALMLWTDKIEKASKFHIYTGSRAVNYENNRLWKKAAKLLEHFSGCQRIVVGNDCQFHVSPRKDVKSFALKIVPAEDLSDENFVNFKSFISQYYAIPLTNFQGSHYIPIPEEQADKTSEITENYQLYIDKVRNARLQWSEPCSKCGYIDDEAASTLNIHLISS